MPVKKNILGEVYCGYLLTLKHNSSENNFSLHLEVANQYNSNAKYEITGLTSTITNNCHTNCASCLGNSGDSNKCFVCQNRTLPLEKQPDGTGTC